MKTRAWFPFIFWLVVMLLAIMPMGIFPVKADNPSPALTVHPMQVTENDLSLSSVLTNKNGLGTTLPSASSNGIESALSGKVSFSLYQALDTAFLLSPRIVAARAQLGISKSAIAQATVLPNPSNYLAYNFGNSYLNGGQLVLQPPWQIFFRLIAAKQLVRQTDLEIMRTIWLFRGEVRKHYAEMVVAQQMAATKKELANIANKLWLAAQRRHENGDVPGLDVKRAYLALLETQIAQQQTAIAFLQAKEQLNIIMGRNVDREIIVPDLPEEETEQDKSMLLPNFLQNLPTRDEFMKIAMENRLELKIVRQTIRTNEANLRNAIGNIVPNQVVRFGHLTEFNPPTGPRARNVFLQVAGEPPLLNVQQGEIAKYRATIKQLNNELFSQKNLIVQQVDLAYRQLNITRAKLAIYQEKALQVSSDVTRIARLSYELGQADITTSVQAQSANILVKTQYLDTVLAYQLALNDLEQAIGRPLE